MMRFRTNERASFCALVRKALIHGVDVAGSGSGAPGVLGRCRISASLDLVSAGSTTGVSSTVSSTSSRHAGGHHELDHRGELDRRVDLEPTCGWAQRARPPREARSTGRSPAADRRAGTDRRSPWLDHGHWLQGRRSVNKLDRQKRFDQPGAPDSLNARWARPPTTDHRPQTANRQPRLDQQLVPTLSATDGLHDRPRPKHRNARRPLNQRDGLVGLRDRNGCYRLDRRRPRRHRARPDPLKAKSAAAKPSNRA